MEWLYNAKKITRLPEGVVGFIYIIYYTDGTKYIGKKLARSPRKKNFGKKKLAEMTDSRLKKYEMVMTEHPWKTYEGSSEENEGKTIVTKHILHLCTNKLSLSYLETKELFLVDAPMNENYNNKVIGKHYWDNALDGMFKGVIPEQCLFKGDYS